MHFSSFPHTPPNYLPKSFLHSDHQTIFGDQAQNSSSPQCAIFYTPTVTSTRHLSTNIFSLSSALLSDTFSLCSSVTRTQLLKERDCFEQKQTCIIYVKSCNLLHLFLPSVVSWRIQKQQLRRSPFPIHPQNFGRFRNFNVYSPLNRGPGVA
jgi:hypothetical protein